MRFLFRRFTIPVVLHGHLKSFSLHESGKDAKWLPKDDDLCTLCDSGFFRLDSHFQHVGVKWQRLEDRCVQSVEHDKSGFCDCAFNARLLLTFECEVNAEYPARTDVDVANALQVKGFRITVRNNHTDDAVIYLGNYRITNVRVDSYFGTVQGYELSEEDWRE